MYNINPGITKNDNNYHKSIFSYNVYRTNNQHRPYLRTTSNFKSTSLSSSLVKDPEVLYFNENILRRPKCQRTRKECSTQTSKTILQLAQTDTEFQVEPKSMSVDTQINNPEPVTNQAGILNATSAQIPRGVVYNVTAVQNEKGGYDVCGSQNARRNCKDCEFQGAQKAQDNCNMCGPQNPQPAYNMYGSQLSQKAPETFGNNDISNIFRIGKQNFQNLQKNCDAPQKTQGLPKMQDLNIFGHQTPLGDYNTNGSQNAEGNCKLCGSPSTQQPQKTQENFKINIQGDYSTQEKCKICSSLVRQGTCMVCGTQNTPAPIYGFENIPGLCNPVLPVTTIPGHTITTVSPNPNQNYNKALITCKNQNGDPRTQPAGDQTRNSSPVRIGVQIEIHGKEEPEPCPLEIDRMSPDSLAASPRNPSNNFSLENCPYSVANRLSEFTLDGSCHEQDCLFNGDNKKNSKPLTQTFLERKEGMKSRSYIDYQHPNYIQEPEDYKFKKLQPPKPRISRRSCRSLELPDNSFTRRRSSTVYNGQSTFMCPTAASQIKSQMAEIQSAQTLIPPMRRGKSTSPKPSGDRRRFESSRKIPYIDQSKSDVSSSTTLVNATRNPELLRLKEMGLDPSKSDCSVRFSEDILSLITTLERSNSSISGNTICVALNKLQELDWRIALRGLADVVEICRIADVDLIYDYMGSVNQRLIELLKSPRSHVCRTACQAAGHLFEYVKDTRRPVFDEIVDILLHKTADANKFIRHDANLALDCMVTHISTFNAVRALCCKGPFHKNPLVRSATARLLVCAVVIAGPDFVLNPNNNEYTRKRIIVTMARFLEDRNLETRKLSERLYKVLSKDIRFDVYLKKYLEKEQIIKIKKNLRLIHKK